MCGKKSRRYSMKGTDTGSERVKKICDVLRRETLEPARQEAEEIVLEARRQATSILEEAKQTVEQW